MEKKYTLGLYEKAMPADLSWKEKLMAAKNAGYDFVEISIDETDEKLSRLDWTPEERENLIDVMYETGVPIRTMCLSGHRRFPIGSSNEETNKKSMEIMKKAIQLADDLGIRIIQLAGYDVYYEESTENTKEKAVHNAVVLEEVAKMAARCEMINPDAKEAPKELQDKHYYRKHGANAYYGQNNVK